MLVKPAVTDLLKLVEDRYELVSITSKRARQLLQGETPLVNIKEYSNVTLAAQEIAAGKVKKASDDEVNEENN